MINNPMVGMVQIKAMAMMAIRKGKPVKKFRSRSFPVLVVVCMDVAIGSAPSCPHVANIIDHDWCDGDE